MYFPAGHWEQLLTSSVDDVAVVVYSPGSHIAQPDQVVVQLVALLLSQHFGLPSAAVHCAFV